MKVSWFAKKAAVILALGGACEAFGAQEADLVVIGNDRAALVSAVCAASEGIRTLLLEPEHVEGRLNTPRWLKGKDAPEQDNACRIPLEESREALLKRAEGSGYLQREKVRSVVRLYLTHRTLRDQTLDMKAVGGEVAAVAVGRENTARLVRTKAVVVAGPRCPPIDEAPEARSLSIDQASGSVKAHGVIKGLFSALCAADDGTVCGRLAASQVRAYFLWDK